ncbi:hypothetical protein HanXRQr2_Chr15g0696751 [Helianthus annuus]|uniref:Uncharacterized protein n=1 Tax=Helianthus annuus TaxID=4232 RepID=A0A9K3E2I1_HELAN|nr:hypothetical protein HanXRQr2_Chr15g0696751 [Helianthus annuus]
MAEPSNPHNVEGENPEQQSLAAADEDEDDGGAPGGGLPVLKWSKAHFETLMTSIQMPKEFGDIYTHRRVILVPMPRADLSGLVAGPWPWQIRNFEYTFRALGLEVSVENSRRFYQLTVNTGFFSFNQRYGSTKLMTPPKGVTKWKTKFFYVKAVAVAAKMTFRNVNETILAEDIALPTAKTVDWFPRLRPIELKKLDNNELWVLRMMLTRPDRKARTVVREKSGEDAALWMMFDPDFKGKVELLPCREREGFNLEIVGNFRVPTRDVLNAPLPQGKGNLGALGKFEAKTVPKKHAEKKHVEKPARGRGKKNLGGSVAPPLGSQVAGTRGEDYSSFFDVPSSPPQDTAADAGVNKEFASPFVKVVSEPSVRVEDTVEKTVAQIFDTVDSSDNLITPNDTDDLNLRFSDVGKQKSDAEQHKSPATEKVSGSASRGAGYEGPPIQPGETELEYYYRTYTEDRAVNYHCPLWSVMLGDDISNNPSFCKEILGGVGTPFEDTRACALPCELRINQLSSMPVGSSIMANAIMEDYQALGRREEEAARLRAEAEKLVKAAREGVEQLEKDKAAFQKHKQTEEWAATSELKQELANVKAVNAALVKEKVTAEAAIGQAREAEAQAAKALEEAKEAGARAAKALEEAKEREGRTSKALEEANADRTRLNQTVGSLKNHKAMLAEVTTRATEAERRASEAAEARDSLTSSFNQLENDREWMRCHGIGHIVKVILDAPETATGIDQIKQRARDAGFKAGYNRCISHMNILAQGEYTDERSGFRGVNTESLLDANLASFYDMSISALEKLDECLDAEDYVDRLRMLYDVAEESEEEKAAGDGKDGAGTSGTK